MKRFLLLALALLFVSCLDNSENQGWPGQYIGRDNDTTATHLRISANLDFTFYAASPSISSDTVIGFLKVTGDTAIMFETKDIKQNSKDTLDMCNPNCIQGFTLLLRNDKIYQLHNKTIDPQPSYWRE